jgi:SAM-dependent methyltransferase
MPDQERRAHAITDRESRFQKAAKIIRMLGERRFAEARDLLEVGCGSGIISNALSEAGQGRLIVAAVDVTDNRIEKEGYSFQQVPDTRLPYTDASFDIVVSNHVIEHVGERNAQLQHLSEIKRVLRPGGVIYLAVPNKWRLVEPHYRLPLLSWLPPALGDGYVRATGRGTHYDCRPLSARSAMKLFRDAGLTARNATVDALRATLSVEHPGHPLTRFVNSKAPNWLLALGMPIVPTFVFLLRIEQS